MQILISDLSLEIPLACFTWGIWSQRGALGPGKSSPGAGAVKKDLLQPVCVDTNNPFHRGLKITFWAVAEFSYVAIGGGMREYGCCRAGAPWDLNHPLFAIWEELGRLGVCSHPRTAHLLQGVFPTTWLGGSSPPAPCWHMSSHLSGAWWWAHVFYSHGQLQKSSSVPLSHLLMEELKQW